VDIAKRLKYYQLRSDAMKGTNPCHLSLCFVPNSRFINRFQSLGLPAFTHCMLRRTAEVKFISPICKRSMGERSKPQIQPCTLYAGARAESACSSACKHALCQSVVCYTDQAGMLPNLDPDTCELTSLQLCDRMLQSAERHQDIYLLAMANGIRAELTAKQG